jgi:hypothetical protein
MVLTKDETHSDGVNMGIGFELTLHAHGTAWPMLLNAGS